MAFAEDTSAFLADFGLPCVAGSTSFRGVLNQPDELLNLQRVHVHSRQYELVYRSADVDLARVQALTVDGQAYTVREAPRQVDDGVFCKVLLSKD